jgi:hypothetical protein
MPACTRDRLATMEWRRGGRKAENQIVIVMAPVCTTSNFEAASARGRG